MSVQSVAKKTEEKEEEEEEGMEGGGVEEKEKEANSGGEKKSIVLQNRSPATDPSPVMLPPVAPDSSTSNCTTAIQIQLAGGVTIGQRRRVREAGLKWEGGEGRGGAD